MLSQNKTQRNSCCHCNFDLKTKQTIKSQNSEAGIQKKCRSNKLTYTDSIAKFKSKHLAKIPQKITIIIIAILIKKQKHN